MNDPTIPLLDIPNRNVHNCSPKDLYKNIPNSTNPTVHQQKEE